LTTIPLITRAEQGSEHRVNDRFTLQQLDNDMAQHENVVFVDAEPQYKTEIMGQNDMTYRQASPADADLADFLSRPVLIKDYDWVQGAEINQSFNPWVDYFSNPRVQEKLANFYLLRCKLVIRVQINATPFHLGSAILSYNPLQNIADNVDYSNSLVNGGTWLTTLSQRPHVLIDASTSQGGSLVVPFMWLDNAIRVPVQADFENMGHCRLDSFTRLYDANSTLSGDVNVSVWVHAQDVELSIPTVSAPFTPQAGDEYAKPGPVQNIASQVAGVAQRLSDIPVIGPFAMATQIGANALSGIASIFGWSRPTVVDDIQRYKPHPAGEFATTDSKDTVTKLTMTSKQELTVDPRTVGLMNIDELTIASIAGKESYLGRFYWATSDNKSETLYTQGVTPSLNSTTVITGPPAYKEAFPSAISFASSPFQYWSGSITFRFKVVCSRYHRGRLRITFDPYSNSTVTTPGNYNVAYQHVLDLAQTRDVAITVPWAQAAPYAKTSPIFESHGTGRHFRKPKWTDASTTRPSAGDQADIQNLSEFCNGFLNVMVQNELKSPNLDDAIEILVFVSAGEDFEVAAPKGNFRARENAGAVQLQPFVPQSGMSGQADVGQADSRNEEENAPELMMSDPIFEEQSPTMYELKPKVFFGERISSFRSLLKRYTYYCLLNWEIFSIDVNKFLYLYRSKFSPWLQFPGDRTSRSRYGTGFFPEVNMTMCQYLCRAYVGWRGSQRFKFVIRSNTRFPGSSHIEDVRVQRVNYDPGDWRNEIIQLTNSLNASANEVANRTEPFYGGGSVTFVQTNSAVEVEVPFYRNKRFAVARNLNNNGIAIDESNNEMVELSFIQPRLTDSVEEAAIQAAQRRVNADMYTAVGEDFNLFFFVGAPVLYYI